MSLSKRAIAEFLGTFWLVFGGCGSAVLAARMMCAEPAMSQETKVLKALEGAQRFAVEGNHLMIYSGAAGKPLRFSRLK